jgi:Fic family protein
MDLPMAAKKTQKNTKKPRTKPAKPARPTARPAAKKKVIAKGGAKPSPNGAKQGAKAKAPAKHPPTTKPAPTKPAPTKPVAKPAPAPEKKPQAKGPAPKAAPSGKGAAPVKRSDAPPPGKAPAKSSPGKPPAKSSPGKPPAKSSPGKPLPKDRPSLKQARSPSAPLREPPPRLVSLPLPILAPPKRPSVEERAGAVEGRLMAQSEDFRKRYEDSLDMSWIYHDSALEGVVYTFDELRTALSGQAPPVTDSSLQPTYDDIRRHKEAIEFVRDYGLRKKLPVTLDVIKKLYLILHPEEGDIKTVKYRKDIPQHRLYFHEYAPPDKIAYKVRQVVDWLNDPETRKTRNGIRIAARAHYDLLRVYPFPTDSGKVSRLFMNLLLMRTGLPPAIIHSTERQRYYEALKGSATTVLQMVQESVENALSSVEKLLDEHESKKRAFVS